MLDAFDAQQHLVRVLIGTTAEFSAVVNEDRVCPWGEERLEPSDAGRPRCGSVRLPSVSVEELSALMAREAAKLRYGLPASA